MRNVWWRFDCSPSEGEILSPQQQSSDCKVGLMDCGMGALGRDQEYFQKNCEVLEGIRNIFQKFGSSWKGSGIFPKSLGALGRDQEYFKKFGSSWKGSGTLKKIGSSCWESGTFPKTLWSSRWKSGIFQKH